MAEGQDLRNSIVVVVSSYATAVSVALSSYARQQLIASIGCSIRSGRKGAVHTIWIGVITDSGASIYSVVRMCPLNGKDRCCTRWPQKETNTPASMNPRFHPDGPRPLTSARDMFRPDSYLIATGIHATNIFVQRALLGLLALQEVLSLQLSMAVETSLPVLLTTLSQSLNSAIETTPDSSFVTPPENGISLLDVKNDLFLSYLQNLVFLIILKLRHRKSATDQDSDLDNAVTKKLVELRVYLEKGVRPLESRLKYQIDKVLRAADDAVRASVPAVNGTKTNGLSHDDSQGDSDEESDAGTDDEEGVPMLAPENVQDHQYGPGLLVPVNETAIAERAAQDGLYRPPRITATVMPTTTGKAEKEDKRARKSLVLDEFAREEISTAPLAEPSIGSTIVSGGRRSKSEREKQDEAERREYEEKNYVRLPKVSKKELKKKGGRQDAGYGGEEWRGLGEGIDRIERLTRKNEGAARSALEKSRKRAATDGPRSSGAQVGEGFQKRLKTLEGGRRDRGRR